MKLLERAKSFFGIGTGVVHGEGSYRGPFMGMGEGGGWHQYDPLGDGWQRALHAPGKGGVAIVYACVMLYCRAVSQCTAHHLIRGDDGGDVKSATSPASRILRYPNEYEHWSGFVYNVVAGLLFDGEVLCLKVRDDRNAVTALHRVPRGNWSIHIDPDTKAIFYGVNSAETFNSPDMLVPAREVVHFRMHTPRHPLIGESPVKAAAMAIGINVALNASQLAFFSQMNRPSGVMSTDLALTSAQMKQLREAFNEQSKAWNSGGMPILSNGLKFQPVNITQADSQLIEQQKLSAVDVARVFGVPMALLAEHSGPMGGTEALVSSWLSVGLGSVLENVERTLDRAFDLPANEHIQLDPAPLLRVDFAGRIEGYTKAVQGGIMSPAEVRSKEGLPTMPGSDQLYMQRQMTSLEMLGELAAAELKAKTTPPPVPAPPPAQEPPPKVDDEPAKNIDVDITKALVVSLFDSKRKAA
jgi:HK97 family phage portal protein